MPAKRSSDETPLLDQWIGEVGEDGVMAAVERARRAITEGRSPGFSNKAELREYLRAWHRHTA